MKKLLALALAAVMMAGCLTACGNDAAKEDKPVSGTAQQAPSAEGTIGSPDAEGTIGTPDAPVKVKIVVKDIYSDEEAIIQLCEAIEKKMAAHDQYIDLIYVDPPAGSYGTALPLAVMNGETDADLIYFQGGDRPVAEQGLLEDLTPYIENSTYVKALMDDANKIKMESYPYLLWLAPPSAQTPVIRTDVLKKLKSYDALVKDPSIDNYYNFFKEMKEVMGYDYAMTFYGDTNKLDGIFNAAFGVSGTCLQEDGKWIFGKASQAEKNKLAFYAKLYEEKLIDPDYLTNTWDVVEQKFYEGKVGIIAGTAGDIIQVYDVKMTGMNGEDAALTVLPPAKGESQSYNAIDVTKESRGFAINVDSKNKEAAWAVLEFMASPEGRILDKVGIEGEQYNIEDGKIVFTDKFGGWWARFWNTTKDFNPEPPLAEPVLTPAATQSLDMVNQYMVMDKNLLIPEELTPQWDAMNNLYNEYASDIIRGVKPIDAFDEMVELWNKAGGDQFAPILAETFG